MTLLETIPRWFLETAIGRKMMAEAKQETLADREAHHITAEQARAELAEKHPPLIKKMLAAKTRRDKSIESLKESQRVFMAAKMDCHNVAARCDKVIGDHEHELLQTYDPAIDEFIRRIDREGKRLRADIFNVTAMQGGFDPISESRVTTEYSNFAAVRAKVEALTKARLAAIALKVVACDDVEAALSTIWDAIPTNTEKMALTSKRRTR